MPPEQQCQAETQHRSPKADSPDRNQEFWGSLQGHRWWCPRDTSVMPPTVGWGWVLGFLPESRWRRRRAWASFWGLQQVASSVLGPLPKLRWRRRRAWASFWGLQQIASWVLGPLPESGWGGRRGGTSYLGLQQISGLMFRLWVPDGLRPVVLTYVNQCELKDRKRRARFKTAPNPRVFTSEG